MIIIVVIIISGIERIITALSGIIANHRSAARRRVASSIRASGRSAARHPRDVEINRVFPGIMSTGDRPTDDVFKGGSLVDDVEDAATCDHVRRR